MRFVLNLKCIVFYSICIFGIITSLNLTNYTNHQSTELPDYTRHEDTISWRLMTPPRNVHILVLFDQT